MARTDAVGKTAASALDATTTMMSPTIGSDVDRAVVVQQASKTDGL